MANYSSSNRMALFLSGPAIYYIMVVFIQVDYVIEVIWYKTGVCMMEVFLTSHITNVISFCTIIHWHSMKLLKENVM